MEFRSVFINGYIIKDFSSVDAFKCSLYYFVFALLIILSVELLMSRKAIQ